MEAGVEMPVECGRLAREGAAPLRVRMLGQLAIERNGTTLALPASRKARALLAYLALAPRPVGRSHLCDLLWDRPGDPRGELRWCLSKVRAVVDTPGRQRVDAREDAVRVDLSDCFVDAHEIVRATGQDTGRLDRERLLALARLFEDDFLAGLEIDRSPMFAGWLAAQRRRFRGCRVALLARLAELDSGEATFGHLEQWLALAPLDRQAHEAMLAALARQGRVREAEAHLGRTVRRFDAEGLDATWLHEAWRSARRQNGVARVGRVARPAMAPAAKVIERDTDAGGHAEAGNGPDANAGSACRAGVAVGVCVGAGTVACEEGIALSRRASIAVMPFADLPDSEGPREWTGRALAHDVITRLAKLRSLFVIAQGSVFALRERHVGLHEAGRMLNVDYLAGGTVRRQGARLVVEIELIETRTARVVWTDVIAQAFDDVLSILDGIGDRIVASIVHEIESNECHRAVLRPPGSLDAWEAHHRGLWHMYRFERSDNEQARRFFETAVRLDPTFSRAWAGLSFTHFQNAFQGWGERDLEADRALDAAGKSLMADDRDPAAHWAMGRAVWLRGRHGAAIDELNQAVALSPNFAQGHYTLAFVQAQAGDAHAAIAASDQSRRLSPFDPMMFGMLGARAMALASLGHYEEAADWAVKAAARPNAHAQIQAIAAFCLALAGRPDEAGAYLAAIRRCLPRYGIEDFLRAMRFSPENEAMFRAGAARIA